MICASLSTARAIISAASLTSYIDRSGPPVMLKITPRAPSIVVSSSGDAIAFCAASAARCSPEPSPMPIIAEPASVMIVLMSAKSRLIRPGCVIRSLIP